jgi:putative endonuclease
MHFADVLWSSSLRKRYIGSTIDLDARLEQHNTGECVFTKRGMSWLLVHSEQFPTRKEAESRERELKSGQGPAWLENKYPHTKRSKSG